MCSELALDSDGPLVAFQELALSCRINVPSSAQLRLGRIDGAVIAESELVLHAGVNRIGMSFPDLLPGQYLIEMVPVDEQGQRLGTASKLSVRVDGQSREFGSVRLTGAWGE